MKFLQPQFLHLAWLGLVVLALHLFRRRAQRREVSTLLFFRWLAREHQESAWLRQVKRWLALLLSLLVVLLAVLALARPVGTQGDQQGAVVLLVDRSASMAARDDQGRDGLERVRIKLRAALQQLPQGTLLSLIAYDVRPEVLLSRSANHRECLRLLESLLVRPMEDDQGSALALAGKVLAMDPGAQLWHASDRALSSGSKVAMFADAALPKVMNAGITAFEIRRAPLSQQRHDVFVAVHASASNAAEMVLELEMTRGGALTHLRKLELAPGITQSLLLPLDRPRGEWLELRLRAAEDCLNLDDAVGAPCPEPRILGVMHVAQQGDPFTDLALRSLAQQGQMQLIRAKPATWRSLPVADVYVFERWLPEALPDNRPCLILEPPRSLPAFDATPLPPAGLLQDELTDSGVEHPVVYRLQPSSLQLRQSLRLRPKAGLQPLWVSHQQTLLAAGQAEGQRLVVTAFAPSSSPRLTLLPAFPLLLGNALDWCVQPQLDAQSLRHEPSGAMANLDGLVAWKHWDGRSFVSTQIQALGVTELDRLGYWQLGTQRGLSLLCKVAESDVPKRQVSADTSTPVAVEPAQGWLSGRPWPQLLMGLLLLLLLVESWLFHRHALY